MEKHIIKIVLIVLAAICMCSCTFRSEATITEETIIPPQETSIIKPIKPEEKIGWFLDDIGVYYISENGKEPVVGFVQIEGDTYYFGKSGYMKTGWVEEEGKRYYFKEDGKMVKGEYKIGDRNYHFTSTGEYIVVTNPWNEVPADYDYDLVKLNSDIASGGCYGHSVCIDDLTQMISDANTYSGARVLIVSAYRNVNQQTSNFNNKVRYYQNQGYSYENARAKAAQIIAIPGTSEHHLGLAFDIIDTRDWSLETRQENYKGQQWLMEHSWEYGFILRYPKNKTDVTGIIYEPWHYRYVGKELAKELHESGLTLEEYFASLT